MNNTILLPAILATETYNSWEYIIGAVIALMILIYLIVTLIKPEKF